MERHGPMVLRVCRGILATPADVEDAFQATFLVLVRRARTIRERDSVGSWLFGVAFRVAKAAQISSSRRRVHEREVAREAANEITCGGPSDLAPMLQEEVSRLPERYRCPVVLFHLEGLSYEETAARLKCPVGTVKSRLARGREMLRSRLTRRGLALSAVAISESSVSGSPAVPESLKAAMRQAAVQVAAGRTAAEIFSTSAATLAEGVSQAMFFNKTRLVVSNLLTAGIVAAGAGLIAQRGTGGVAPELLDRSSRSLPARSAPEVTPSGRPGPEPVQVKPPAAKDAVRPNAEALELALDDNKAAGKRSIAGSGHAVRFEAPGEGWSLTAVKIHGARYGYPRAPAEDFFVYLCDDEFHKIVEFPFPYSKFKRGRSEWVTLKVKATPVPPKFIVGVGFNPEATKGVYVSHDGAGKGKSVVGLPDEEPEPFPKGDWMIRAKLERTKAVP